MKKIYTTVLFVLFVSAGMAQPVERVLVMIGSDITDTLLMGVKNPVDAIKSIEGFTWEFDYITGQSIQNFSDFESYDLAFITENPGSTEARYWGVNGIKALPTLNFKAWAIRAKREIWPLVDDVASPDNWWAPEGDLPNTDVEAETEIEINEDHPILDDMGKTAGETFSLATDVPEAKLGSVAFQTFIITDDTTAAHATVVGISLEALNQGKAATNILYAIDESSISKKHVILGTAQQYLEFPTAEMNQLITGSVKWLLGLEPVGIEHDRLHDMNTMIYPNPASQTATLRFDVERSANVDIHILNALGQSVYQCMDLYAPGMQQKHISVKDFATGIYFVKIQINGLQQVQKLLVK